MDLQAAVIALGVSLEVGGIGLLSIDLLNAWWRRSVRGALRARRERLRVLLTGVFRRRRTYTAGASLTLRYGVDTATATESASVVKRPDDQQRLPDQVRYLAELAEESQERLSKLESDVPRLTDALEQRINREVEALREEFARDLEAAIGESEAAFLRWRLLGFALALGGTTMLAVASIV